MIRPVPASPKHRALAVGFIVLTLPLQGLAQPPGGSRELSHGDSDDRPPPAEAVEFYRRGHEHFRAGRYREAVEDLTRAMQLDPSSPTLVYNLARVHELLGDYDEAIASYHRYAALLPPDQAGEHERVRETLARLEGARSHAAAQTETPPPQPPADFELNRPVIVEEHGVADALFWIPASVTGAALLSAFTLGVIALTQRSALDDYTVGLPGTCITNDSCDDSWDGRADQVRNLALASDLLFGAAAIGGVASFLLYILRSQPVETFPDYGPSVDVSAQGVALRWRGEL